MPRFRLPDFSNPKAKLAFMLTLGAVVVAFLFIFAVAIPAFSNPSFCGMFCHSQRADIESWKKSSHANVTCYSCHMPPGVVTLLMNKAKDGALGGYYEITGNYHKPINGESEYALELESVVCERCHNMDNRKVTAKEGIIIDHKKHLDREIGCTVCHNRIAHGEIGKSVSFSVSYKQEDTKGFKYEDFMTMDEGCFRCHTRRPEESELLKEHRDWKGAPAACAACHPRGWKKLPVGHDVGWRAQHGDEAKKNIGSCYSCHDKEEFCNQCHGE